MAKYTPADLEQYFIDGTDNSLKGLHKVPLNQITCDFAGLSPQGVQEFKTLVVEIVLGSKEQRAPSKPDPISAILMNADRSPGAARLTESEYEVFEATRIADKWRGNHIGKLNELICCLQPNMEKSAAGKLDVIVRDEAGQPRAIAEVKNRFNTMNSASAIRTRKTMESLVLDRGAVFHGCDAVLVERVPKKDGTSLQFNPSDPSRGQKGVATDKIKRMGLHQFLEQYGKTKHAYVTAIILLAQTLHEQGIVPEDYDMRFIFKLLNESLS
ncbi:Eco47II family restriction endonuclease [Shewanella algae]|uniref:Eco47II family restriction endonuclease n=1 Tax=Shewanella algae TaxID=38313 RepID=UPI001020ADAD